MDKKLYNVSRMYMVARVAEVLASNERRGRTTRSK